MFFEVFLRLGRRSENHRAGFPVPETQLSEQALALPNADGQLESFLDEGGKRLTVPDIARQSKIDG
jgi:hypothetical protein